MKYVKCPRCGLNYMSEKESLCAVCKDEINNKKSIFDDKFDELICPFCEKNVMGYDEIMCSQCRARRDRNGRSL